MNDYNVLVPIAGSSCLGTGLGLFKKVAMAKKSPGPRFTSVFVFYVAFCLLVICPLFKFPALSAQLEQMAASDGSSAGHKSAYYEDRLVPVLLMVLIGLLLTVGSLSLCNALQHPTLRQSIVNLSMTFVLPGVSLGLSCLLGETVSIELESGLALLAALVAVAVCNG